ncbi:MAG: hypothetical protein R3F29_07945 [Planctomycetota bacterium]
MSDAIYVGPARVLSLEPDGRPRVQALGGAHDQALAEWALPFHYQATPGELLLVVGRRGGYWVTGIVAGSGESTLAFRGDVTLHAHGPLVAGGDGGLRIDSPAICIEAEDLDSEVEHAVQRVGEFDAEVSGAHEERLGQSDRIVDEDDQVTAARHETIAAKAVRIDGSLLRIS